MAVLHPVKLTITNYPEDRQELFPVENNPNRPEDGERSVSFSRTLFIEAEDFMEEPIKKYFRLFPGNEVRLKGAYVVKCTGCIKDAEGNVVEVLAEYDPKSAGGNPADGRKVRGTIHWVDSRSCMDAQVRLYDNLFTDPDPDSAELLEGLNPDSLEILAGCKLEAGLRDASLGESFQFMRLGYFTLDTDTTDEIPVFNRAVTLKDSFKVK